MSALACYRQSTRDFRIECDAQGVESQYPKTDYTPNVRMPIGCLSALYIRAADEPLAG